MKTENKNNGLESQKIAAILLLLLLFAAVAYLIYTGQARETIHIFIVLFKAYAWPHAITVLGLSLIYVLRKSIRNWMDRLAKLNYKTGDVDFSPPVNQEMNAERTLVSSLEGHVASDRNLSNVSTGSADSDVLNLPPEKIQELAGKFLNISPLWDKPYFQERVKLLVDGLKNRGAIDAKEQLFVLLYASAECLLQLEFERIYRLIFKSQSAVLRLLHSSNDHQSTLEFLKSTFAESEARNQEFFRQNNFDFNAWLRFLISNQLMTIKTGDIVELLDKGRFYLEYLEEAKLDLNGLLTNANY
jgi:hypothetical protein